MEDCERERRHRRDHDDDLGRVQTPTLVLDVVEEGVGQGRNLK